MYPNIFYVDKCHQEIAFEQIELLYFAGDTIRQVVKRHRKNIHWGDGISSWISVATCWLLQWVDWQQINLHFAGERKVFATCQFGAHFKV